MQVGVTHEGEEHSVEVDDGATIRKVLELLDIPPSTVLAIHDGVIVPHDSRITSDISIELVVVSSGG
tara:strand:+ start:846 stop:1046 length:201 start_codon:yes stop_codon:yes gene_type:complete